MSSRVLYLFGCAAPPVLDLPSAVDLALSDGWTVCVGLTPTAADWLGPGTLAALEARTGRPVRSAPRRPYEEWPWPDADATLIAPATLNSVNTFALGLTPHFVAAYVAEGIGKRWPMLMMPCVNAAYATHPQFGHSVSVLRDAGVRMLYGEGGFVPRPPGESDRGDYPWGLALSAARDAVRDGGTSTSPRAE
ncbi:flavoprotein [Streptomyces sp. NPDC048172]|uniref:flavoprotein n=1 Tax=Streptomyces sp. NPDC048172 TaxID=3365505 RepID=UPI00371D6293